MSRSVEELKAEQERLKRELYDARMAEYEAEVAARRCVMCGLDVEPDDPEMLIDATISIGTTEGLDGSHMDLKVWYCDEHIHDLYPLLEQAGMKHHAHYTMLLIPEDESCPGAGYSQPGHVSNFSRCPTPQVPEGKNIEDYL